ncbi:PQQ-dependent sugar dehydrogenase [Paenibacillus sp. IB182496]|uniref:PQQ-dependent sugar dehydrogenase n=1 Tax=Paenibacillus sabuli TaxID=2772509 RepID=A0A927BWG9_9BACL|nr:PQQ-dependent sugar dehydrogenase [Paenibacillus sabuli]MBD2846769.1 PQQ-dependent sugar dehydrogenase [Paenibacillus sabuli]
MKRIWHVPCVAALLMLGGCGWFETTTEKPTPEAPSLGRPSNTVSEEPTGRPATKGEQALAEGVLAANLQAPWSIAYDPEAIYISERGGDIVALNQADGSQQRQTLALEKEVHAEGEGGLLGLVLAANFSTSRQAYAYHTYEESGTAYNRIVVLELLEDGSWRELRPLLEGIPGGAIHNGGRLALGPDGKLYATTGDAGQSALAQELDSLAGKILRLNPDGSVPEDNPWAGSYVYSYGHRNPQGIAWSQEGTMYAAEHGPSGNPGGHDELNRIEAGANYGWPDVIGDETGDGLTAPLYHTSQATLAPSGLAVDGEGRLLAAGLRGEQLLRFDPGTDEATTVLEGEGRLRDVLLLGEWMYVLTNRTDGRGQPQADDDRLLRISMNS